MSNQMKYEPMEKNCFMGVDVGSVTVKHVTNKGSARNSRRCQHSYILRFPTALKPKIKLLMLTLFKEILPELRLCIWMSNVFTFSFWC